MSKISLKMPANLALDKGERILLVGQGSVPLGVPCISTKKITGLRVGDELVSKTGPVFKVLGVTWLPGDIFSARCLLLEACEAGETLPTDKVLSLEIRREGFSLAWITLSDKGSRGERVDTAGPLIAELIGHELSLNHSAGFILPDEEPQLRALLTDLALTQEYDLVVTSGCTGVALRDVTPEATLAVIEKRLPGMERAMTAISLEKTARAMISRAVAGTLGQTLIINLPGSPKAVRECLESILPALEHALKKLQGDPTDCAQS